MFDRTNLTQEEIDWLIAHPELNALLDRLIADLGVGRYSSSKLQP